MLTEPYEDAYGGEIDEVDDDDAFDGSDPDGNDGLRDHDDDDDTTQNRPAGQHATTRGSHPAGGLGEVRSQPSFGEGSGSLPKPGDDNRHYHHNKLGGKRHASIKTSFNDMPGAISSLRGSNALRAVIMQRVIKCIRELHRSNVDRTHCFETLHPQNDSLDS
ncbi:putative helix-loop-helix zipper protein [Fasciola hepatica]|uniref:Helix-loop-helix zipper protein n=1 Tax=Fasciola hepatica TaxID=6192 RepID=A0A4E0QTX9_FASHE|nr:putative helix-loop-helix zipper protein [Fasciola hepatica]